MKASITFHSKILKSLLLAVTFLLLGCGEEENKSKEEESVLYNNGLSAEDSISDEPDTVIIGTSADYMPFEFVKDGEIIGFDIDVIKKIAEILKINIVVRDMQFYSLIPALQNGDIHIIISGMFETPERKSQVDFSTPYYHNEFSLLISGDYDKSNPIKKGMRLGVQTGSLMYSWIINQHLDVDVVSMDRIVELVEDLKNGRLDGILIDDISAKEIIRINNNAALSSIILDNVNKTGISIASKRGSKLGKKINEALSIMKKDGSLQEIKDAWLM